MIWLHFLLYKVCYKFLLLCLFQWQLLSSDGSRERRGVRSPLELHVIYRSGAFFLYKCMSYSLMTVWGTVSTSVGSCYKHDICIRRIVTRNTLNCAILGGKFQYFSGEGLCLSQTHSGEEGDTPSLRSRRLCPRPLPRQNCLEPIPGHFTGRMPFL